MPFLIQHTHSTYFWTALIIWTFVARRIRIFNGHPIRYTTKSYKWPVYDLSHECENWY